MAELERGTLRLMRNQWVRGYCMLIAKKHYTEPFQMYDAERTLFFEDMSRAAQAMQQVFAPDKLNYELLGNEQPHLHVHLKPRYIGDPVPHGRMPANRETVHLSDDDYWRLVGDLREALGMIRERVNDPLLVNLLDNQGRVIDWPHPKSSDKQMAVRRYLASRFEAGREYTEREVNELLKRWHIFEDWALLRRELFMHRFLKRMKDGSAYWLNENPEPEAAPDMQQDSKNST